MGKLSDWRLNYQVAAFGACATIFVESIYLILGGSADTSLLSISIINNGTAVLTAGFRDPSLTPLAVIRICLTSLFLLCATILREDETFDGTYAILCSVAHLVYQLKLSRYRDSSEGFLPQHRRCAKPDEAPSESCLHAPSIDCDEAADFSGSLRIFFGDSVCLEGTMVPVTILGTAMTYRVFDFDLGFGLVFAFLSAVLSSVILLSINYARTRGRRMKTQNALEALLGLILVIGALCSIFFTYVKIPDVELSWWRIAFGVAWCIFLFRTTYVVCRYTIHATLFSCEACDQRAAHVYGPLAQGASASCIWEDYVTLPVLNQDDNDTLGENLTFRIRRQKGPDLVERFWLNDQEWFQISPRSFVILLVTCIALAFFSGSALIPEGIFDSIGSHASKNTAFYVTMAFTFVSTGHTPAGDSPELMFVSLRHSFPDWKATTLALLVAMLVHACLVVPAAWKPDLGFATSLACTLMAPLLLAGLSHHLNFPGQSKSGEPRPEDNTVGVNSNGPTAKAWTIDSAMVLSSSKIRCLDLRMLLLGLSITVFDVSCNQYQDENSITRWPMSAVVAMFVMAIRLYLGNTLPRSRELSPGTYTIATTTLVGVYSQVNFLNAFGLYGNDLEGGTPKMPNTEHASRSELILVALWYTALISIVAGKDFLVQRNAEHVLPAVNGRPTRKDHLLVCFHVKMSRINFVWQLRRLDVEIYFVFATIASCSGDSWPLKMNSTIASLLLFALIEHFQLRSGCDILDEKISLRQVAALGFSALMTVLAIGLNRHGVLHSLVSDPKSDWKAGASFALASYFICDIVISWFEEKEWFTRLNHGEELPIGLAQDEEKATIEDGEKGNNLGASSSG